jgi:hypothetical protein
MKKGVAFNILSNVPCEVCGKFLKARLASAGATTCYGCGQGVRGKITEPREAVRFGIRREFPLLSPDHRNF